MYDVSHFRRIIYTGRKCQTLLLFCGSARRRWSPGRTNPGPAPRTTAPTTVNSARFGASLRGPGPASPSSAPPPAHALSYKEAAAGQERGAAREKGSAGLPPAPRRAPRQLPGPARPSPDRPGPRTLQSTATASGGMMSASSLLLGSSFLASFWARAELNVTFTMAWPGVPSEGGGGLGRGLRAPGCGRSLLGRAPGAAQRRLSRTGRRGGG